MRSVTGFMYPKLNDIIYWFKSQHEVMALNTLGSSLDLYDINLVYEN